MQLEDFCNNHWLDSPLHNTAERFDSPLHKAAERFDFPLQNVVVRLDSPLQKAAERFDSPMHHAAGSQTLILITPRIWKQIRKKLRIWFLVQGVYFWWKKLKWKISRYCPLMSMLYVRTASPCPSSMSCPCCMFLRHVTEMETWRSMLLIQATGPCCWFILHVHAACPCWLSMLHVPAACPCCLSICFSVLHVHAAYPWCMSLLHVMFVVLLWFIFRRCSRIVSRI